LYGDHFYRSGNLGTRWGSLVGGIYVDGPIAGWFRSAFDQAAAHNFTRPRFQGSLLESEIFII